MSNTTLNDIIENCMDDIYECGSLHDSLRHYIETMANAAYALGYSDGAKHDTTSNKNVVDIDDIQIRGIKATSSFLKRKGYQIITDDYDGFNEINIVAYDFDDSSFHYVKVVVRDIGESFVEPSIDREAAEADAIHYMNLHPEIYEVYGSTSAPVVFDICTIMRTSDSKAMLRYHENALGDI